MSRAVDLLSVVRRLSGGSCDVFTRILWFKTRLATFTGVDLNEGTPPAVATAETLAAYKAS